MEFSIVWFINVIKCGLGIEIVEKVSFVLSFGIIWLNNFFMFICIGNVFVVNLIGEIFIW